MKTTIVLIIFMFLPQLVASSAKAECNLKIATSVGRYIAELERAGLQKYQNQSVCEVLDYEYWNCSKAQRAKLEKAFRVKDVLGNYCQPHVRPQNVVSKEDLLKGVDLYSWKDPYGYFWYALLPGTNRVKTSKELTENRLSEGYLKELLVSLPAGTSINWNNGSNVEDKEALEFAVSPQAEREIKARAVKAQLQLAVPPDAARSPKQ